MFPSLFPVLLLVLVAFYSNARVSASSDCSSDVGILLDDSGSVGSLNWDNLLEWVADELYFSPPETKISIIRFSTGATVEWGFDNNQDKNIIRTVVRSLSYTGGLTYTRDALQLAVDTFLNQFNPSQSAKRTIVLITDGPPFPYSSQSVCGQNGVMPAQLTGNQIEVLIYAIGSFNLQPLECLVNDVDTQITTLSSFSESSLSEGLLTEALSQCPSTESSAVPTSTPSVAPSALPSAEPSNPPTAPPTNIPSRSPSAKPSNEPSVSCKEKYQLLTKQIESAELERQNLQCAPSTAPSTSPSGVPSSFPSDSSTAKPSAVPTTFPSNFPSATPFHVPSTAPSAFPTGFPSTDPSSSPSNSPLVYPSSAPSMTEIRILGLLGKAKQNVGSLPTNIFKSPKKIAVVVDKIDKATIALGEWAASNDVDSFEDAKGQTNAAVNISCNGLSDNPVCDFLKEALEVLEELIASSAI